MAIRLFQVDAFAERLFEGNPAAVCPLDSWLPDDLLQKIAGENNLSETAFFVREAEHFALRWFTPEAEVDLCGHATLAAAHVLFEHLGQAGENVSFSTRSGTLEVTRSDGGYSMDFPAHLPEPVEPPGALGKTLGKALGTGPLPEVLAAFDYVVPLADEAQLVRLEPDFAALRALDLRGVVVTAPGDHVDFVSRCFYPKLGVDEDPVTGSAHCELAPYWAGRLGRRKMVARQLSRRPGTVICELVGERVILTGRAVDYMSGTIRLEPPGAAPGE